MGNLWYRQTTQGHNADGVTVAQCVHITIVSSFQPIFFIPVLEKSCLEARKAKLIWCITKCRENNLLYETVGRLSTQTHVLSLLHPATCLKCNWEGDYLKQNICFFQSFSVFCFLSEVYILNKKNKLPREYCRWQDGLLFTVPTAIWTFGWILYSALPFWVQLNEAPEPGSRFCIRDMGMALPRSTRGPSPLIIREHSHKILLRGRVTLLPLRRALAFIWVVFKTSLKTWKCSRECLVF